MGLVVVHRLDCAQPRGTSAHNIPLLPLRAILSCPDPPHAAGILLASGFESKSDADRVTGDAASAETHCTDSTNRQTTPVGSEDCKEQHVCQPAPNPASCQKSPEI